MKPIRFQLMDIVRSLGGTVKNNDSRIPALLKQVKDAIEEQDNEPQ